MVLLLALGLAACGGDGQSDSTGGEATTPSSRSPPSGSKEAAPGVPTSKGGDNSIQTWGVEAPAALRGRLTALVQEFLDARADADWAKACSFLATEQRAMFEKLIKGKSGNAACAEGMEALASGVAASAFAHEAGIGEVLSLRVGGGHAFLIYTRLEGKVYATALSREDGAWKIVSVGPTALS